MALLILQQLSLCRNRSCCFCRTFVELLTIKIAILNWMLSSAVEAEGLEGGSDYWRLQKRPRTLKPAAEMKAAKVKKRACDDGERGA